MHERGEIYTVYKKMWATITPRQSTSISNTSGSDFQSQASPQSSSAASFGFISMTLGVTTLGFTTVLATFLTPAPDPTAPVVVVLVTGIRPLAVVVAGFASPLGNRAFDLAFACAFSQPSKSGSPPSSKVIGAGTDADLFDGASKKESSPISPQASSISSSSSCASVKNCSVEVRVSTGAVEPATAWRCRFETDVEVFGLF